MSVQSEASAEIGAPKAKAGGLLASRHYALFLLTVVYTSSFIDRSIINVLLQPIKEEFGASDTAMGFMTGFSFAIFYATLGLPIAMLADRTNRRNLVALAITVWSAMTAAGGIAQSFTQLVIARIGVGVGEAGSGPPSHSMIADIYPLAERTRAMAFYSSGIHLGSALGALIGGAVAYYWGWRMALFVVGVPGLLIALLVRFTLREPARGQSDGRTDGQVNMSLAKGAGEVFRISAFRPLILGFSHFWRSPTLRHLVIGCTLVAFIGYGAASFGAAYMMRVFGLNVAEVGIIAMLGGAMAVAGGLLSAWAADHFGKRDSRWVPWIVAATKMAALPFICLYYFQNELWIALVFYVPILLLAATYQGPTFGMVQTLSPLHMRAQASAILLFVINLIGMGTGPLFVGFLSDSLVPLTGNETESLRWSMFIVSCIGVWGAVHYYIAGKHYPGELAALQTNPESA